jgi:hypothetical protein
MTHHTKLGRESVGIKQSLAEGQWLQEEPFEVDADVHGNVGGPRKGRIAVSQQVQSKSILSLRFLFSFKR